MSNFIVGWPNWTGDMTLSGGSWETAYPVTNAASDVLARVARSTDLNTSSLQIDGTFSEGRIAQVFGIALPNASTDAQVRLQTFDSGGGTVHDSGWLDVFPEVFDQDALLWEANNFWSRKYLSRTTKNTTFVRPYDTSATAKVTDFQINLADSTNPDGFLDVAYITLAERWQFGINPAYGLQLRQPARTRSVQARGGAKSFDRLPKARRWEGAIEFLTRAEAMQFAFEHQRLTDVDEPFLVWPFPGEPRDWPRTVFIGRNRELNPIRYTTFNRNEVPISFEEVL